MVQMVFGFGMMFVGVFVAMILEHIHFAILYAPTVFALILGAVVGGSMISHRPEDITGAVKAAFSRDIRHPPEKLLEFANLFDAAGRYASAAGWIGLMLGVIHVLGSIEEAGGDIGKLASGIALAMMAPFFGLLCRYYWFMPLKNNLERKARLAVESSGTLGVGVSEPLNRPMAQVFVGVCAFMGATFLLLLLSMAAMALFDFFSNDRAPRRVAVQSVTDTGASAARPLDTFLLGNKRNPNFRIVLRDGQNNRRTLTCAVYLGFSRDYSLHGPAFFDELRDRTPMLREIVIRTLGSKTPDELQVGNLDTLEDEILFKINATLDRGSVSDVIFSEYIIE